MSFMIEFEPSIASSATNIHAYISELLTMRPIALGPIGVIISSVTLQYEIIRSVMPSNTTYKCQILKALADSSLALLLPG